jgi:hypothetical protein
MEKNDYKHGAIMSDLKKITSRGYPGMLVFAKIIESVDWDDLSQQEMYEYSDKMKSGFILELSKSFEEYYLVRFFDGERSFHWGVDLYENTFQKDLTGEKK